MPKITSKSLLNVGTEILIDEVAKTITLVEAGNLVAKDGVTGQAVYSLLVDLWTTEAYQDSPFPMYAIDVLSGQFQFGTDGSSYSGWKPANDSTRSMLRDCGWTEFSSTGTVNRIYACFNGLGSVNSGAQPYYQLSIGDAPTDFPFADQFNVGVQVYGDASNGNFDKRTYAKTFVREYGKKYKDSVLADTGKTGTGAFKVDFLISNEDDLKIQANDGAMSGAPYSGISVIYYDSDQMRTIGGGSYPFRTIIEGNGATLEQIYTKIQYLLRQNSDIDSGAGTVNGKTASAMLDFVGDALVTRQGVFIENIQNADVNRITFTDQNGVARVYPFVSAGALSFNAVLVGAGSSYRLMYTDKYGTDAAVTVKDASGDDITGVISTGSIAFTYDYDGNTQDGKTPGTDRPVTLVGVRPGTGKFATATGTLTRGKTISISLVAETDRAYSAA